MSTLDKLCSIILPDALYGLDEAKQRLHWKEAAMRTARRKGLKVKYMGGRGYILGSAIIAHVTEHGKDTK
jgi:hypothetical protein